MGLQPAVCGSYATRQIILWGPRPSVYILCIPKKLHNELVDKIYHLWLFIHVRTADKPKITNMTLCHKKLGYLCYRSFIVGTTPPNKLEVRQQTSRVENKMSHKCLKLSQY